MPERDRGRGVECRRGIGGEGWSAGEEWGERGGVRERGRGGEGWSAGEG